MRRAPEGSRENSQERLLLLLNFRRDFCFVTENIFTVAREIGSFLFLSFFPSSLSLSCTGGSFHRRLFRCCLNPHGLSSFIFQTLRHSTPFFQYPFSVGCVLFIWVEIQFFIHGCLGLISFGALQGVWCWAACLRVVCPSWCIIHCEWRHLIRHSPWDAAGRIGLSLFQCPSLHVISHRAVCSHGPSFSHHPQYSSLSSLGFYFQS